MVSKTIIEGSIPSTPATREIIALLGVIFFIKKSSPFTRVISLIRARRKLQPYRLGSFARTLVRSERYEDNKSMVIVALLGAIFL